VTQLPPISAGCASAAIPPWTLYTNGERYAFLVVLFLISTSNSFDQLVISVMLEPIKLEFRASDKMLGLLTGICFALCYALFGIPVAKWADRGNRRTIVTLALTIWSAMTVCCGLARTFGQLALARVGVGAGESGLVPTSQSLIADYFPPEKRASAYAIFTCGLTTGYLLGIGLGGYIAATYGWRTAFLIAGVPGLGVALISRFGLSEPRLRLGFPGDSTERESVYRTVLELKAKRSFLYALFGFVLYCAVFSGALSFIPSFLVRVAHVSLAEVGVKYGGVVAVGTLSGTLSGGWLADRLSCRDIRWLAWLPAVACTLAAPVYVSALAVNQFRWFLGLAFVAWVLLNGTTPLYAAIHAICGNRRRATVIAILLFCGSLFGGSLGPLIAGAISDALSVLYGAEGLRYALMLMMPVLILSGGLFYLSGRAMLADLES
jgi:predicted MFS family arabinose efflux permease